MRTATARSSRAEIDALHEEILGNIKEIDYFTSFDKDHAVGQFAAAVPVSAGIVADQLSVVFDLALEKPLDLKGRQTRFAIYDGSFYTAMNFQVEGDAVTLTNAPKGLHHRSRNSGAGGRHNGLCELPVAERVRRGRSGAGVRGNGHHQMLAVAERNRGLIALGLAVFGTVLLVWFAADMLRAAYISALSFIYGEQRAFHQSLIGAVRAHAAAATWATGSAIVVGSFFYGVFHAAGPGHGKVVLSAYLLSRPEKLGRSVWLAAASSLVQGLVAIALIYGLFLAFGIVARDAKLAVAWSERLAFAMIVGLGLMLIWRGVRALPSWRATSGNHETHGHEHHPVHDRSHQAHDQKHQHTHEHEHEHGDRSWPAIPMMTMPFARRAATPTCQHPRRWIRPVTGVPRWESFCRSGCGPAPGRCWCWSLRG